MVLNIFIKSQVRENISNGLRHDSLLKFSKGHNSVKNVGGVTILISAYRPIVLNTFIKFRENISKDSRDIE